jgi:hypothetical protein
MRYILASGTFARIISSIGKTDLNMNRQTKFFILVLLSSLLLAACARFTPAALPKDQPATAIPVIPTSTASPSPTSAPPPPAALPLATPYADQPAAGICAEAPGELVVTVEIMPDIPSPRCLKVTPDQRLRVVNRTDAALALKLGSVQASLQPNGETTFEQPFGKLLAPGVHVLDASPYFGPEIVLVKP